MDQGFRRITAADAGQTDRKQGFAWQLASPQQFHGSGHSLARQQPARAWLGEALGEVTAGQDAQFARQALGRHQGPHHQQRLALGTQMIGLGAGEGFVGVHALARAISPQCAVSGWQAPTTDSAGGADNGAAGLDSGTPMPTLPILPGTTVVVNDPRSIYNGYKGFVQRISGSRAAVLFEGGNWDKLVTLPLATLLQEG